ncbi:Mss4-like protein [Nemania sp. NC0429]|nr:Mss4-like protein [Nemania sp. NC0429]
MASQEEMGRKNRDGDGDGDRAGGREKEETFELRAHCLCQTHAFTATVPRASLPLAASYCHCTSCRHVTGALYSSVVAWPANGAAAVRASSLRRYGFAATMAILYCGACGSTMFAERRDAGAEGRGEGDKGLHYAVQTGVLVNAAVPRLLTIADHMFLSDTLDGGASPWLCGANGEGPRPRLWAGRRGESEELSLTTITTTTTAPTTFQKAIPSSPAEVPIQCHCGGVDLVLHPPAPHYAAQPRAALPWFVDPSSNKSLAGFDACDSCRLSSGSDVFHWTFVLLRHLDFPPSPSPAPSSKPLPPFPASSTELMNAVARTSTSASTSADAEAETDRDPRWGTLTCYASSPGVQRYFCGCCSAVVFYAADDRPELVDLAIGLLRSADGAARAESLLSWDFGGAMVWRGDVAGGWREAFVASVEAAAERWRIGRGYPKNWRRVQKEEAARIREG